jgi:hypothetical protein
MTLNKTQFLCSRAMFSKLFARGPLLISKNNTDTHIFASLTSRSSYTNLSRSAVWISFRSRNPQICTVRQLSVVKTLVSFTGCRIKVFDRQMR